MKIGHRRNYALLALAIVYFVIAIIQICADGILSTRLYFSVAFISINTTLCELIKSSINWVHIIKQRQAEIKLDAQNITKRHTEVLGKYPHLYDVVDQCQKSYESIEKAEKPRGKIWRDKYLDVVEAGISFVEILLIISIAIITPLKVIPNNFQTTKVIDVLSLLSIAFAFLSVYMNESTMEKLNQGKEMLRYSSQLSDYYLNIIESISKNQSSAKEAYVLEDRKGDLKNDNDRKTV